MLLEEGELNMIVVYYIYIYIYMQLYTHLFIIISLFHVCISIATECRSLYSHLWKEGFGSTIRFHLSHSTYFVFPNA